MAAWVVQPRGGATEKWSIRINFFGSLLISWDKESTSSKSNFTPRNERGLNGIQYSTTYYALKFGDVNVTKEKTTFFEHTKGNKVNWEV